MTLNGDMGSIGPSVDRMDAVLACGPFTWRTRDGIMLLMIFRIADYQISKYERSPLALEKSWNFSERAPALLNTPGVHSRWLVEY